jgi:RNA polymerase sigma-70 factor, ECF subfamily
MHTRPGRTEAGASRRREDEAMDRYAAGETAAFVALYDALAPRLWSMLCRRVRDPERAADLLQETMLRIHRARGVFVPGSAVGPWAFAIALRVLLNDARRNRRKPPPIGGDLDALCGAGPDPDPGPEQLLVGKEMARHLTSDAARLSPALRVMFHLVRGRGFTIAQAARRLGISVGTAKVRLHRACSLLRASLPFDVRKAPR